MKYVMLDFDGVLTTGEHCSWWLRSMDSGPRPRESDWFDPVCVERVQRLCQTAGAVVVLSTSWKSGVEPGVDAGNNEWPAIPGKLAELTTLLQEQGLTTPVIGSTPMLPTHLRGNEILLWLWRNNVARSDIVILDDYPAELFPGLEDRLVCTAPGYDGFTEAHLATALELLSD